jgi:co-chaperonin GroES (HSP10)
LSKYLSAFKAMKEQLSPQYELIGDCILVEELPKEEVKTKSGLILESGGARKVDGLDMNKPLFVRVLAVGEGYYDETTGNEIPLNVQVGDIILVGRIGVNFFSTFCGLVSETGNQIGLSRESEIRMRFKGEEGYQAVQQLLVTNVASS